MSRPALLAVLVALGLAASAARAAAGPPPGPDTLTLEQLGLSEALREGTLAELSFPFSARGDRTLESAEVRLRLARTGPEAASLRGLEVLVNQRRLALLGPEALQRTGEAHALVVPPSVLREHNVLTLRLSTGREGPCGGVPPGAWRLLRSGELRLGTRPVPLPDELSLLPLPFLDPGLEREAAIPLVFGSGPTHALVRLAGMVAGRFGREGAARLRFPVHVGALPEGHAVVLLDGAEAAARLGLPPPAGPALRMTDRPGRAGRHDKLLVVEGRSEAELETAVRVLAAGERPLAGAAVRLDAAPGETPASPYDTPRWLPSGRVVTLGGEHLPPGSLTHRGSARGAIALDFGLAPDLWAWPREHVELELGYTQSVPEELERPQLDVELNGAFLGTLPALPRGAQEGRVRLWVPRAQLRRTNALRVHVRYPEAELRCASSAAAEARVSLTPDSALHLEHFRHYLALPDVAALAHDGFPFTRVADLGEAALVLPDQPRPEEVSAALSALAHFASVTGRAGTRLSVIGTGEAARGEHDRDLLVVGLLGEHPLLQHWAAHLPLAPQAGAPRAQRPAGHGRLDALAALPRAWQGLEAPQAVLGRLGDFGAAMQLEHPGRPGRSVVVLTATSPTLLPALADLQGALPEGPGKADLLVLSGGRRWLFRLGPAYDSGRLDAWTGARWFFANHWRALWGCSLAGALGLALALRAHVARRTRARLGAAEEDRP